MNAVESEQLMNIAYWKEIINILSHSENRVPYTYHHDYIRSNTTKFNSRSDVAQRDASEYELYACCLAYLIQHADLREVLSLDEVYSYYATRAIDHAKYICNKMENE